MAILIERDALALIELVMLPDMSHLNFTIGS